MRIPRWMMKQRVTVEPFLGTGAYGPQYGEPFPLRCRIEPRREVITTSSGTEVVAMGKLYAGPSANDQVPEQSRIKHDGAVYDAVRVQPEYGDQGRVHHTEIWLA